MRLFYALPLPLEVQNALEVAQKKLRGNWRPVRLDHLHITFAFLPQAPDNAVQTLVKLGNKVGRDFAPFKVRLRGTGYFPGAGSPRVWFVKAEGVEGDEMDLISSELRSGLTLPFEDKPFKAHITLARKKGPAPRLEPMTFPLEWEAQEIVLIESQLHKSGPEYKVVKKFPLTGPKRPPKPLEPEKLPEELKVENSLEPSQSDPQPHDL
jgi:RNA 2',3'-cyclic 3'-phosphodiesterase